MDDHLPRYLRWLIRKLGFLAVPNLGMLICGLAILAFLAQNFWGTPYERFVFDPDRVLEGEWWRLFAFPLSSSLDNPIWLLFYLLFVYYVLGALESAWGAAPLTLFVMLGYLSALGGAFLTGQPVSIWFYVLENAGLAFGTLFPNVELLLFLIIPVKAKWLAWLSVGLIGFQFFEGDIAVKIFIPIALFPYFLFFTPRLIHNIKTRIRVAKNRQRFNSER